MKEADIRPQALFNTYLDLNRQDVAELLSDHSGFQTVPCPACGGEHSVPSLAKDGFTYALCASCDSLFLNPRPTAAMMERFYAEAKSVRFWSTDFYRETAEARRKAIFRPRAEMAAELASRLDLGERPTLADIGAGYGLFLEEAAATGRFGEVTAVEPVAGLADSCRAKGFRVVQKLLEDLGDGELAAELATAFEVLEHVSEPLSFLQAVRRGLKPGGIAMMTTLTVTGFDIQVLWEHSKAVHPPHHVNLLSVAGMKALIARAGLELVELTTPGKLDVDIVANTLAEKPAVPAPRFVRTLLAAGDAAKAEFQAYLVRNALSSHIRVIVRRPR